MQRAHEPKHKNYKPTVIDVEALFKADGQQAKRDTQNNGVDDARRTERDFRNGGENSC